jgi:hypothetical protein
MVVVAVVGPDGSDGGSTKVGGTGVSEWLLLIMVDGANGSSSLREIDVERIEWILPPSRSSIQILQTSSNVRDQ